MFGKADERDKTISALMEENAMLRKYVSELLSRLMSRNMEDVLAIPQQYEAPVDAVTADREVPMPDLGKIGEVR